MRLLIDNQLPPALAGYLGKLGWYAVHVSDIGMDRASDSAIWRYAATNNMVIVTKDQDFRLLSVVQGYIPPQVIWVRLGNCRRTALFDAFRRDSAQLRQLLTSGSPLVEIR